MRCANCSENKWENVDEHRIKPQGMSVCTECGFISYPAKWKTEEEIKKHYRESYRNPPTHQNLYSCERKNNFHRKFLLDLFEKWKKEGIESPRILEIGAAFGFTLQWVRSVFPKAEICGTELTTSFRRNAYYEFGVKLDEDIDMTKKYDLIISYKVLEHQLDPDKELEKYRNLLTPNGVFYISVPTWFNSLINFGASGFDLEYYFSPDHINVWSQEMFENILARSGFEVIKSDQIMYSSTYLCKPNESLMNTPVLKHDVQKIKENLVRIKQAYLFFTENKFEQAIALWSDYPQAHASRAEISRRLLTEKGWDYFKENIIDVFIKDCPTATEPYSLATDFAMRAGRMPEAIKYAEQTLLRKPENPNALMQMLNIMRELALNSKDLKERLHYFAQAREVAAHLRNVSTQHFKEATDLIYFFNSQLPFKGEHVALAPTPLATPVTSIEPHQETAV